MKKIVIILLSITFFNCTETEAIYTDISVNIDTKTLSFREQFVIKAISDLPIEFESENDYFATVVDVNPWKNATIRAGYVGETTIRIHNGENSKEVKLNISPQLNLYPTPPLDLFGNSKTEIINIFGTPNKETETTLRYSDYSEDAPYITYNFNNKILTSITISVKDPYPYPLNYFLSERYRLVGTFNDTASGFGLLYYNSLKGITPTITIAVYRLQQEYDAVVYRPYIDITEGNEITSKTFSSLKH